MVAVTVSAISKCFKFIKCSIGLLAGSRRSGVDIDRGFEAEFKHVFDQPLGMRGFPDGPDAHPPHRIPSDPRALHPNVVDAGLAQPSSQLIGGFAIAERARLEVYRHRYRARGDCGGLAAAIAARPVSV